MKIKQKIIKNLVWYTHLILFFILLSFSIESSSHIQGINATINGLNDTSEAINNGPSFPQGSCGGTTNCNCGDLLTSNHTMNYDLLNCPGMGIQIGASNVELNCNSHTISGVVLSSLLGVRITGTNKAFIKKCNIVNFTYGIFINDGIEHSITNNFLSWNTNGIFIDGGNNHTIYQNTIINNSVGYYVRQGGIDTNIKINKIRENSLNGVYTTNQDKSNPNPQVFWGNILEKNGVNAYEDSSSPKHHWNLSTTGNMWGDFSNNPGYPNIYIVDGPGSGVDYYPNNGTREYSEICNNNEDEDQDNLIDCNDLDDCGGFCITQLQERVEELEQEDKKIWKKIKQIIACITTSKCTLSI